MAKYECSKCKEEFISNHKGRKFCSLKCSSDFRNDLIRLKTTKICNTCKIEKDKEKFNKKSSKRGTHHFECKECQSNRLKSKPQEWHEKEKIRSRKKSRIKAGLDPDYEGKYRNTPFPNPNKRWKDHNGYILIYRPDHLNTRANGLICEHVFVMSQHIGRALAKKERVHHKNSIKTDNRIENLELWTIAHPTGSRVEDKISWCKEFLEEYGYEVIKR